MQNILKTRRTVKRYVYFNLLLMLFVMTVVTISTINSNVEEMSSKQIVIVILIMILFMAVALVLIWLFYQLLYGILLRKLKNNYKEIAELDMK